MLSRSRNNNRATGLHNTLFSLFSGRKANEISAGVSLQKQKTRSYYFCSLTLITTTLFLLIRYFDSTTVISEETVAFTIFSSDPCFHSFCPSWVRTVISVTKGREEMSAENSRWNLKITFCSENSTSTNSPDEGYLLSLHCKPDKIRYIEVVNKLALVKD